MRIGNYRIGDGSGIRFWTNYWCGSSTFSITLLVLFELVFNKHETVTEVWNQSTGQGSCNLEFERASLIGSWIWLGIC